MIIIKKAFGGKTKIILKGNNKSIGRELELAIRSYRQALMQYVSPEQADKELEYIFDLGMGRIEIQEDD